MNDLTGELKKQSKKERLKFLKQQAQLEKKDKNKRSLLVKSILTVVMVVIIAFFGYLWVNVKPVDVQSKPASGLESLGGLKLGDQAPDFSLLSTKGQKYSLDQYKGKNVLLYFNEGVMCAPCWKQITTMEQKLEKFNAIKTEVLTIAVDSVNDWEPILKAEKITHIPVLIDSDRIVSDQYGVLHTPSQMHQDRPGHTYIFVDKEGKVAWIGDYPTMRVTDEEVIASISKAMKKVQ